MVRCVRGEMGSRETTKDATAVEQMSGEKGLTFRLVVSKIKAQGHKCVFFQFRSEEI